MGTAYANERGTRYGATVNMVMEQCCSCGIPFQMPEDFKQRRREDRKDFYCPQGHAQHYTGKTEAQKQRERAQEEKARADRLAERLMAAHRSEQFYRDQAAAERRTAAAYKGHVTRMKKKIHSGICPVSGCSQHFTDVRAHMRTRHTQWLAEHPEVVAD